MKFLKILGYILLGLIALILILGLFAPKEVQTQQSLQIDAAPAVVYNTVNDLTTWGEWSPWMTADSTVELTFGEQTSGEGASYSWTSENSGAGTMTITAVKPNETIDTHVDFGWMGGADAQFIFEPTESGTKTTWTFHSKSPYPLNTMNLFMSFKEFVDQDYARGLQQLADYIKENATPTYTVREITFPATHYIADRAEVPMAGLNDHFQTRMPALGMAVGESGLQMTGMPAGIYYNSADPMDIALAIPVTAGAEVENFITIDIPEGPALQVDYYGNYDGLGAAHEAMAAHLLKNGLTPKMPFIEIYKTDPGNEPDPTKWLTEVVYFVAE